MHSLDAIFNNIEPEELTVEKQQSRKYNHYIYLMAGWRMLENNDLTPYVRKLRRIMEMFPDIAYYPTDDLTDFEIVEFGVTSGPITFPDGYVSVCAFSFLNPNTRSVMRLYETIRKVTVELEKKDHYMFLDSRPLSNQIGYEFIYSEQKDIHRIVAHIEDMEIYASSPDELVRTHNTKENIKTTMLEDAICKTLESEISAGGLEEKVVEWSLRYSNNFNVDGVVKFSEIKDVRGFANGKVPCDGDKPHEVWNALPSRFIKTGFAVMGMNEMRHPETIVYRVPELSNEWVKNCSSEIIDSRVFKDTKGDIVILYSLKVLHEHNIKKDVRVYLMSKLYTSHKKFSYDEAHRYFKLLLNDGHILDNVFDRWMNFLIT